jgi:hypothetical protein
VAAVVEAAHRQPDLRGCPLPPRRGQSRPPPVESTRPSTAAARHVRPDRHRAVAAMVEAASRQSDLRGRPLPPCETQPLLRHGCRCAAWWGRERGDAATLVNDHLLLLEHGPPVGGRWRLWQDNGRSNGRDDRKSIACAPRRPCPQPCRRPVPHLSRRCVSAARRRERKREERMRSS